MKDIIKLHSYVLYMSAVGVACEYLKPRPLNFIIRIRSARVATTQVAVVLVDRSRDYYVSHVWHAVCNKNQMPKIRVKITDYKRGLIFRDYKLDRYFKSSKYHVFWPAWA